MMSKAYPKYKPSGVEWLGDVPEHWANISLKWASVRYSGGTPDKSIQEYWEDGTIPWLNSGAVNDDYITEPSEYITKEAFQNSSAKWIPKDALVMALAGQGKTKGMVGQLGFRTTCNQSMAAIVPDERLNSRMLYWWLTKNYINIRNLAGGEARDGLNLDMIGSIPVPLPPLPEQQAIASFLDRETGRIDSLIGKKQRLLQLLAEQRTALISRAVTKGLDAKIKLKPSGVEWLGDVPEHWGVKKLKFVGDIINGYSFDSNDFIDNGVRVIKISNIQTMNIDWTDESFVDEKYYQILPKYRLFKGDFIFALTRPIISTGIKVALVDIDEKVLINQRNAVLRPKNVLNKYVFYLFNNHNMIVKYNSLIDNTGQQPNISSMDIKNIELPYPPMSEQQAIAVFLDRETAKIDTLSARVGTVIEQLKEYRTALISSAVTGKIDVREAV